MGGLAEIAHIAMGLGAILQLLATEREQERPLNISKIKGDC